ncbi:hypothetical protein H4R18_003213 [Coemansia javaensis]|uniref:Uncharacterized protein n=1 Tax=Coemansia javaensis TaxID=2761396 RepID=A0A9W8H8K7_9FUNG|nr:hypothetical protein H4R18_003213 [Coemansia javaensis]
MAHFLECPVDDATPKQTPGMGRVGEWMWDYVTEQQQQQHMDFGEAIQRCIGFVLTALCWGFTNPFIKRGSAGVEDIKRSGWARQVLAETWFLATRWQYVLALAINLSGSAVYYYTLGSADITIAVPITNSLALVFTVLAGMLVGERPPSPREALGMAGIVLGAALCVTG